MYYTVYPDVIFAINLMMDYALISTWAKITNHTTTYARILLASMSGTLFTMVMLAADVPHIPEMLWTYLVTPVVMLRITARINIRNIVKDIIVFYLVTIIAAGFLMLSGRNKVGCLLLFVTAVLLIQGADIMRNHTTGYVKRREYLYAIKILLNGKILSATGLYDSGNGLNDPYNGKPVCVANKEIFYDYIDFTTDLPAGCRLIPYNSVGEEKGLLWVITADRMVISRNGKQTVLNKPEFALYDGMLSKDNEYQIIINRSVHIC